MPDYKVEDIKKFRRRLKRVYRTVHKDNPRELLYADEKGTHGANYYIDQLRNDVDFYIKNNTSMHGLKVSQSTSLTYLFFDYKRSGKTKFDWAKDRIDVFQIYCDKVEEELGIEKDELSESISPIDPEKDIVKNASKSEVEKDIQNTTANSNTTVDKDALKKAAAEILDLEKKLIFEKELREKSEQDVQKLIEEKEVLKKEVEKKKTLYKIERKSNVKLKNAKAQIQKEFEIRILKLTKELDEFKISYDKVNAELEKSDTSVTEKLLKESREERDQILKEARELKSEIIAKATEEAKSISQSIIDDAKKQAQSLNSISSKPTKSLNEILLDSIGVSSFPLRDDLKEISGIGPLLETTLNSLGIYSYSQIARMTKNEYDLMDYLTKSFPGRAERDDWARQAIKLINEKTNI